MKPETKARVVDATARYQQDVKTADAPPAQSRREKYLSRNLARTKANLLATEAEASGATATPTASLAQLSQERIIGTSDLFDINYLELAIAVGRAVARIQIGSDHATGFLVGPELLITNNHVLENEGDARRAVAQFDYQDNASGELLIRQDYRLNPDKFFVTDKTLDFTLVGVESLSGRNRPLSDYPWLKLIAELGKAEKGDDVNIIQHPRGNLKQIAFRRNEVIEIPDGKREFLYYTTDTEPGSSGSPCFNDQWELIALHHSGVAKLTDTDPKQILRTDGQVWREGIDPEGLIAWLGNEGARVSAIVAAVRAAPLQGEMVERRTQMLDGTPPNPIELARGHLARVADSNGSASNTDISTRGDETTGQSHTWTIPIQVTVTVGGAAAKTPTVVAETKDIARTQPEELGPEISIDQDWTNRKGYDPNFLGTKIPLPKLSQSMKSNTVEVPPQFRKNDEKFVLNYHHYSVVMNKKRRCAWFSAAMIDGSNFQDFNRGTDKWFLDPRIDSKFQMGEELYAAKNTDRGHLTRFKDLSWGRGASAMDQAVKATNDSFHFTNCALQLDGFNQGKDRWQGLELFLLEKFAKKNERKMVLFTGPILKSSDPTYRNPAMNYTARIPLAFWKVCVLRREDGSLSATAFTLGQEDVTDLPGFEEKFEVAEAQTTLADLTDLTGLDFGPLVAHDHFANTGRPGALESTSSGRRVKPIENYDDIVM
jgi:endonuclease G, mitochondrial